MNKKLVIGGIILIVLGLFTTGTVRFGASQSSSPIITGAVYVISSSSTITTWTASEQSGYFASNSVNTGVTDASSTAFRLLLAANAGRVAATVCNNAPNPGDIGWIAFGTPSSTINSTSSLYFASSTGLMVASRSCVSLIR